MKMLLTIAGIYLAGVGIAQEISSQASDSPTADQVAGLPSFSSTNGLVNIAAGGGLLLLAHSAMGKRLLHSI